ncbi:MAG: YhfC family intramembrane metalloprotease [Acetatifactor sp.]|nr:YhfC family intramembrane metalloprotease [Acetatifactor sp.]
MNLTVSTAVMAAIIFVMVMGIVIPVGMLLVLALKYKCKVAPFFIGCATFLVFAMVLEQILHMVVIQGPWGWTIQNNIWLYALYGGTAAALFEEVGRFLAMKYILAKKDQTVKTGLMYGAGHGGFECMYILVIGMINNLATAFMLNTMGLEKMKAQLAGTLSPQQLDQYVSSVEALATTSPALFLVSILERVLAVTGHIVMSLLVWKSVTGGKKRYFGYAFAMHFAMDAGIALVNHYFGIIAAEICIALLVLVALVLTVKLYKKDQQ